MTVSVGERFPLTAGALGKAYLAWQSRTDQRTGTRAAVVLRAIRFAVVTRVVTRLDDDLLRPRGLRVTRCSILATIVRPGEANVKPLEDALAIHETTLARSLSL